MTLYVGQPTSSHVLRVVDIFQVHCHLLTSNLHQMFDSDLPNIPAVSLIVPLTHSYTVLTIGVGTTDSLSVYMLFCVLTSVVVSLTVSLNVPPLSLSLSLSVMCLCPFSSRLSDLCPAAQSFNSDDNILFEPGFNST